jgi:hypothetical protein
MGFMRKLGKFQQKIYDIIGDEDTEIVWIYHQVTPFVHSAYNIHGYFLWNQTEKGLNALVDKGLIVINNRGYTNATARRVKFG